MTVIDDFLGVGVRCALATVSGEHLSGWRAYDGDCHIYAHKGEVVVETRTGAHRVEITERITVPAGLEHRIALKDAVVELLLPLGADPRLT